MTPIGAVVVDDEPLARANIVNLLRTDPEIAILAECSSGTQAIKVVRERKPALLFLDVQMPGCDGFGVLEALGLDVPPAVVFVTAYDRYALKAFEAEALDYLLKPFANARFFRVLARAKAVLAQHPTPNRRSERIMIRSAGRISFLPVDEIDWIEAADYYSCLHLGVRTHLLRRSMADLERDLEPNHFCRIHRSTIVNLARVRDLRLDAGGEYEVVLRNETRLKVSRGHREKLQSALQAIGQNRP
ncbi:MAG TPA: LytTR family DNA-binding domain-containing protein [Bryobacteraceae bacterium]